MLRWPFRNRDGDSASHLSRRSTSPTATSGSKGCPRSASLRQWHLAAHGLIERSD